MKTKHDFKKLNFNEYAFFKDTSTTEAKWKFANILFPANWLEKEQYYTRTGIPKIKTTDLVEKSKLDFTMKSNSRLEGQSRLDYLCDFFNAVIPLSTLREYSENKTFIKALKFTGKNQVINDILNREQLLILQKTWLFENVYMKNTWSDKAIEFIENTDWAKEFLKAKLIKEDVINNHIKLYHETKTNE